MRYTVWSCGELIGTTELEFRGLGFDRCLSGDFYPTGRGAELMPQLASDSHCMRAFFHRDFRDALGHSLLDPEYVGSDWFANVAEHLQQTARYALELRNDSDVVIRTTEIGIQDKQPDWPAPLTDAQLEAHMNRAAMSETLQEDAWKPLDHRTVDECIEHDRRVLDEMFARDEEQMEGLEYDSTPIDIIAPVGWDYEETRGDNELGSGWNSTLRDIPIFSRYQVHVLLAE